MLFNSIQFIVFLPVAFALHWACPHKYRWIVLLALNCFFYMYAVPKHIFVLLAVIAISYFSAILIEKSVSEKGKKLILAISVVVCLGALIAFKYLGLFFDLADLSPGLRILVPTGISFYTLQTIGYIADVYHGRVTAEKHPGYYALFVSFFPQILSGPIGRAGSLLPQIKQERRFNYDSGVYGMKLLLWGAFEKTVIADNLAYRINLVFGNLQEATGGALFLAIIFYAFQLYCDFCGYTNMARGVSKLMGIDLMENFRSPYLSSSVRELWTRWHISLSTWFRDYVYIPLGGSRCGKLRHYFNLMVTFLASGLWHGANWTYMIWGGMHGVAQIFEDATGLSKRKSHGMERILRIFLVFVFFLITLVVFRASSFNEAGYIYSHILNGFSHPRTYISSGIKMMGFISVFDFLWHMAVYLIPLAAFDIASLKTDVIAWTATIKPVYRHALYVLLIVGICLLHSYEEVDFVYLMF